MTKLNKVGPYHSVRLHRHDRFITTGPTARPASSSTPRRSPKVPAVCDSASSAAPSTTSPAHEDRQLVLYRVVARFN